MSQQKVSFNMAKIKYRVIAKVLCDNCETKRRSGKRFDTYCKDCNWVRYTAREGLVKFEKFLNFKFPNWIFINVYEYVKGEKGNKLASFVKGKDTIPDTL